MGRRRGECRKSLTAARGFKVRSCALRCSGGCDRLTAQNKKQVTVTERGACCGVNREASNAAIVIIQKFITALTRFASAGMEDLGLGFDLDVGLDLGWSGLVWFGVDLDSDLDLDLDWTGVDLDLD